MKPIHLLFLFALPLLARVCHAADEGRPNILLAIADDMSWAHTSMAGCTAVKTPNMDRVARSGVLFRNGFCAAPGCAPSRAALLTGRHVWMNEEASVHFGLFPAKFATYPDLLAKAGYATGFSGKPWSPGKLAPGRTGNPVGPGFNAHKLTPPLTGIKDTDYTANFADFLAKRKPGQPFCFWYGGSEPHRDYEAGSGLKSGKKLAAVSLPSFLPDTPETRSDFLDYLTEIEWFDRHLGQMLDLLEKAGELENTLIIVTADNGMPMMRAKATCYEYGLHVPMEIAWPKKVPGGRIVDDPIGFVDLTATILSAAQVQHPGENAASLAPVGRDLLPLLTSTKQGLVTPDQAFVFAGHERHTLTRHNDLGYPIRALRTPQYLYLRNLRPERWPVGDPQRIDKETGKLLPLHAGCYRDVDDQATLHWLIKEASQSQAYQGLLALVAGRHPAEELYDIQSDPDCLHNLAADPTHSTAKVKLSAQMDTELKQTQDPRLYGPDPDIADRYPHVNPKNKPDQGDYPAPKNAKSSPPKKSAYIDTPRPTGPGLVPADISTLAPGTEQLDLYLLIGQSNMKGRGTLPVQAANDPRIVSMHLKDDRWYVARHPLHLTGDAQTFAGADNAGVGPGLAFAQALATAHPHSTIGLIPCAVGGTSIGGWRKGGDLYANALRRAKQALAAGPKGKTSLRAVLWLQGEADAKEASLSRYPAALDRLVTSLRGDLARPALPFIASTIGEMRAPDPAAPVRYEADINRILLDLPNKQPHTGCVDARDLKTHIGDFLHFDSAAQNAIGQRFAKALLELK
jgi:uncharacterized sulfatase